MSLPPRPAPGRLPSAVPEALAADPVAWLQTQPPRSPLRQRVLQSLAERAAAQPAGPQRSGLLAALQRQAAFPDPLSQPLSQRPPTMRPAERPTDSAGDPSAGSLVGSSVGSSVGPGPLAALVRQLQAHAGSELRAVQQHPQTWGTLRVARRLAELAAPAPARLGPLNNQVLLRRALQRLQTLSPDYLQALLTQLDGLAALAPASVPAAAATRPAPSKPPTKAPLKASLKAPLKAGSKVGAKAGATRSPAPPAAPQAAATKTRAAPSTRTAGPRARRAR